MTEREKELVAELFSIVKELPLVDVCYILGVANGMVISSKQNAEA